MPDPRDVQLIDETRNTSRFYVERRAIAWVSLVIVVAWGLLGVRLMPEEKDPEIPVRVASVITAWPGADATQVEQLVTRSIEQVIAQNPHIHPPSPTKFGIRSISLPGMSLVQVNLDEEIQDTKREFSDINLRLNALSERLPQGAGPIRFNSGFGETAGLMLTIASPMERETALAIRARTITQQLESVRLGAVSPDQRAAVLVLLPRDAQIENLTRAMPRLARALEKSEVGEDVRVIQGSGFAGVDASVKLDDDELLDFVSRWLSDAMGSRYFHPDAWRPVVVRSLGDVESKISSVAGPRFTYRQLTDYSDLISRSLGSVPQVAKVFSTGSVDEWIYLVYSQDTFSALSLSLTRIVENLSDESVVTASGAMSLQNDQLPVYSSPGLGSTRQIGEIIIDQTESGVPVSMSALGDLHRGYESPPRLLNYYSHRDAEGRWIRMPAVTLSVELRSGQQIADFGRNVEEVLAELSTRLPEDLLVTRTSDQPRQVRESIGLFVQALYEAIVLVVIVAFIGFRDWRASLLLLLSIPLTLAMTFGAAWMLGIHLQQVSIAAMIIALGLLVDDPVVASDAIKRSIADGHPRRIAAWLGPTKLARAILFATITNVVAYLPFVMLTGNTGDLLYSLPIMMAAALISSRIVSMTFLPLLGYYILRPPTRPEAPIEERRTQGATGRYARLIQLAIDNRKVVLATSVVIMAGCFALGRTLKVSFFPNDVQYLSTIDVWLPTDASVPFTAEVAGHVEEVVRRAAEAAQADGVVEGGLHSLTTFVGGGGPRFWQTLSPQLHQANYAQIVVEVDDKDDTPRLAPLLQEALSLAIPGVWVDVKQLQTNPTDYPVAVSLSARLAVEDVDSTREIVVMRKLADELVDILRSSPAAERARHDWMNERFALRVDVDSTRAGAAGISNRDVALASQGALSGLPISSLLEDDKQIPIVARLDPSERPRISSFGELAVYKPLTGEALPLAAVASVDLRMGTERILRQEHFRTVKAFAYPRRGFLASDIMSDVETRLATFEERLPPGFGLQVEGEVASAHKGFRNLSMVLAVSIAGIFIALVFQFENLIKPLIVMAGVPFGFAGGLVALVATGSTFSFMAFLGLVALVGVIVSHIIVLFDFIEAEREQGRPIETALIDAGVMRFRPVLITVGATVLALFPLALHGGPLWVPLCIAQIGGLAMATLISLLIVPVLYAVCVEDLGIVKWEVETPSASEGELTPQP